MSYETHIKSYIYAVTCIYYPDVCIVYYCVCNIGLFAQFKGKINTINIYIVILLIIEIPENAETRSPYNQITTTHHEQR